MASIFTVENLDAVVDSVATAWRTGLDRDWSARAGTLEWSCSRTADHAVDTLLAPAFFLASRRTDTYPPGGWSPGVTARPEAFIEGVEVAGRILGSVVAATPDGTRAILFRHDATTGEPADFAPRGALELVLHAHDVCRGLEVDFDPPRDACENLREHVRDWSVWGRHWPALRSEGDPWTELLRSSGRLDS